MSKSKTIQLLAVPTTTHTCTRELCYYHRTFQHRISKLPSKSLMIDDS